VSNAAAGAAAGSAAAGAAAAAAGAGAAAAGAGITTREPELLTHEMSPGTYNYYADDDYSDDDPYGHFDDGEFDDYDRRGAMFDPDGGSPGLRKKKIWRRVRRACYVAVALMFVGPAVAFAWGYAVWNPERPEQVAAQQSQTIDIKFANGQELTRIAPDNGQRTMIHNVSRDGSEDVSKAVVDATLAAEDPTFYTNPGIDFQGILRAIWSQLTRADDSGGSTVTQEYIKLSTGADQHTYLRKFKEIVLAVKMTNQQPKDEILKAYLNTAYYGRGANGIFAAAEAYFGKTPKDLNPSEAAVLAGMVQRPTTNDPATHPDQGLSRWTYVADNMAKFNFISPQQRSTMQLPKTRGPDEWRHTTDNITGSQYLIRQQVLKELEGKGYSQDVLARGGYTITTTIDPNAQQAAEQAVAKYLDGQPQNLKTSLVAVDPKSGGVKAYYGGKEVGGFDYADDPQSPGSSFKPFVALAGLEQNPPMGIGETYDGGSPQTIAGSVFANDPSVHCDDPKNCGVREAMTKSVNTVFVNMAVKFQTQNVQKAAWQAGIAKKDAQGQPTLQDPNGVVEAGIALGQYPVRPVDMAGAYATFANEGMQITPHFVVEISNYQGKQSFVNAQENQPKPAFSPDPVQSRNVADNVTQTMLDVAEHAQVTLAGNRPVASKSGTNQYGNGASPENANAWYVGYTPQITTAVAMLADDHGNPAPLKGNVRGAKNVNLYGSTLSGPIWRDFMNAYLTNQPVMPFPKPVPIGQFELKPPPPPPPPPSSEVPSPTSLPPSRNPTETSGGLLPSRSTTRTSRPGSSCGLLGCTDGGSTGSGQTTGAPPTPTG
jgi:membrane peptidoglycan carboxypeptidase